MKILETLGSSVTGWVTTSTNAIVSGFKALFLNTEGGLSEIGTTILTFGGIAVAGSLLYVVIRFFKK